MIVLAASAVPYAGLAALAAFGCLLAVLARYAGQSDA